jgi:uncharacterized protein (DUF934 family)
MPLYQNNAFVADAWIKLADDAAVPAEGDVILPLPRWRKERSDLAARAGKTGVSIAPGENWDDLVAALPGVALIALVFPKYTDGRAFSTGTQLRVRHDYKGEIRAVGDVLLDEIALMIRCGFDAFEVTDERTIRALERGYVPKVSLFYQPALGVEAPAGTRPWLRRRGG